MQSWAVIAPVAWVRRIPPEEVDRLVEDERWAPIDDLFAGLCEGRG